MSANESQVGGDHYKVGDFEHWDMIELSGVGYLEGCASKYIARHRKKNGREDLEKAVHYVDKLIELAQIDPGRHFTPSDWLKRLFLGPEYGHYPRRPRGAVGVLALSEFLKMCDIYEHSSDGEALRLILSWSAVDDLCDARGHIQQSLLDYYP